MPQYTPIQQRIMNILGDGMLHPIRDMVEPVLEDSQGDKRALAVHICILRRVLNKQGLHIVCEAQGTRTYYRLVRLLHR